MWQTVCVCIQTLEQKEEERSSDEEEGEKKKPEEEEAEGEEEYDEEEFEDVSDLSCDSWEGENNLQFIIQ